MGLFGRRVNGLVLKHIEFSDDSLAVEFVQLGFFVFLVDQLTRLFSCEITNRTAMKGSEEAIGAIGGSAARGTANFASQGEHVRVRHDQSLLSGELAEVDLLGVLRCPHRLLEGIGST